MRKLKLVTCEKLERYVNEREKEARIENSKKMIALGKLSLEDISICSGLSLSEVKELAG